MKNQHIVSERNEILARIKKHLTRGDLGLLAVETGFTKQYVRKVLSPSFATWNLHIIDAALNLANRRQKENANRELKAEKL